MIKVPDNTIAVFTDDDTIEPYIFEYLQPLQGERKRDWFVRHAYFCLPLLIGNQYGIAFKSLHEFTAVWNGGETRQDVDVRILSHHSLAPNMQLITSHFGMGLVTIQSRFTLRTPEGVNLMTMNAPNYFIDGIQNMVGVIETDNLRRDFTLNLKLTRKNHIVHIKKGDIIGCILPVPRYFCDKFEVKSAKEIFPDSVIDEERQCARDFGKEREGPDRKKPHGNGRRYWKGEDVYGNKFPDHQVRVK